MGQKPTAPLTHGQLKDREATDPRYQYLQTEPERLKVLEQEALVKFRAILETNATEAGLVLDLQRNGLKTLPVESDEIKVKDVPITSILLAFNRFQSFPLIITNWASTLQTLVSLSQRAQT